MLSSDFRNQYSFSSKTTTPHSHQIRRHNPYNPLKYPSFIQLGTFFISHRVCLLLKSSQISKESLALLFSPIISLSKHPRASCIQSNGCDSERPQHRRLEVLRNRSFIGGEWQRTKEPRKSMTVRFIQDSRRRYSPASAYLLTPPIQFSPSCEDNNPRSQVSDPLLLSSARRVTETNF